MRKRYKKTIVVASGVLAIILIFLLIPYETPTTDKTSQPLSLVDSKSLNLLTSFEGVSGPGYKDHPDAGGAVGPDKVVDFTGSAFVVHDKKTGRVLQQLTQTQFWQNAGIHVGVINDPRIIYDPLSSRWFAVESAPYDTLAISADSNPSHPWKAVTLSKSVSGDLLERIGVDRNGVYVCSSGAKIDALCFAISKNNILWSNSSLPSLTHMAVFPGLPFESFPATDLDPLKTPSAPEIFFTRKGVQNQVNVQVILQIEKITWIGDTAHISPTQDIPTKLFYSTPKNAVQPGGMVPNIKAKEDHRFMSVSVSNGSIFSAIGTEINGRVGFDWYEVRVKDGAILEQSTYASPSYDILFPTLVSNPSGTVAISFTKTSKTEYPSVYVMERKKTDAVNTLQPPVRVVSGTAAYACPMWPGTTLLGHFLNLNTNDPVGWGTYTTTVTDPNDLNVFWTYQEYANSSTVCHWNTHWVSFSIK